MQAIKTRRLFFQSAAGVALLANSHMEAGETEPNVFGPLPGYSPQIGTLVSEMNWMREAVLRATRGMNQEQLDFYWMAKLTGLAR